MRRCAYTKCGKLFTPRYCFGGNHSQARLTKTCNEQCRHKRIGELSLARAVEARRRKAAARILKIIGSGELTPVQIYRIGFEKGYKRGRELALKAREVAA